LVVRYLTAATPTGKPISLKEIPSRRRRSRFASTRLRCSNGHCRKSWPSGANRSKAQRTTSAPCQRQRSSSMDARYREDWTKRQSPLIPARVSSFSEICTG
jgi:hypothetical protein